MSLVLQLVPDSRRVVYIADATMDNGVTELYSAPIATASKSYYLQMELLLLAEIRGVTTTFR